MISNGTRVSIVSAGSDTGRTGTVVAGTLWSNSATDPGDRVVSMDDTGERLIFQAWMMRELTSAARVVTLVSGSTIHIGETAWQSTGRTLCGRNGRSYLALRASSLADAYATCKSCQRRQAAGSTVSATTVRARRLALQLADSAR